MQAPDKAYAAAEQQQDKPVRSSFRHHEVIRAKANGMQHQPQSIQNLDHVVEHSLGGRGELRHVAQPKVPIRQRGLFSMVGNDQSFGAELAASVKKLAAVSQCWLGRIVLSLFPVLKCADYITRSSGVQKTHRLERPA